MDKILSARVDESVIRLIGILAQRQRTTKKAVIESAISAYAKTAEKGSGIDLLEQGFGAWRRRETAEETVEKARKAFRTSMQRRHK